MAVHYYPFINKIITQLQLRDKVFAKYADGAGEAFPHPFITIAREPGSGGRPIAQDVAKTLGFTFVDDQIIEEIASSTKKRKEVIQAVDEKSRTAISDMVHSMFNEEYVDDIRYLTELAKIVLAYASQGKTVIFGRGANFITPFAKGLHVYITAPYDVRVQRAVEYEGHTLKKAKKVIADIEEERAKFVKQYLRKDPNKKNAYDLILNTTYFDMPKSRDLVLEAFYKKFPATTRYKSLLSR